MWTDVVDLHEFYRSHLGQIARRLIRERIRRMWPDVRNMSVLGLGYATPYLRPFLGEAERVTSLAPAQQGVMPWPSDEPGLVVLADETELPFADLSIDRLLIIHVLSISGRWIGLQTGVLSRPRGQRGQAHRLAKALHLVELEPKKSRVPLRPKTVADRALHSRDQGPTYCVHPATCAEYVHGSNVGRSARDGSGKIHVNQLHLSTFA